MPKNHAKSLYDALAPLIFFGGVVYASSSLVVSLWWWLIFVFGCHGGTEAFRLFYHSPPLLFALQELVFRLVHMISARSH